MFWISIEETGFHGILTSDISTWPVFCCLFCWVKGHKLQHIPGQWHPHWSEKFVSRHFLCVFFSGPSISGILSSQMSRFDQDTWSLTESAWWPKVALVLGRVPKVKGRRFQHFQTFHDIVIGWSTTLRHEVKSIHRHEAMIFPILVHCRFFKFWTLQYDQNFFQCLHIEFHQKQRSSCEFGLCTRDQFGKRSKKVPGLQIFPTPLPETPNNNF